MKSFMENILSDIRKLALEVVPSGGEAWLYGSRARGTAHAYSDWDILLILNKEKLTQPDYDTVSYPFRVVRLRVGRGNQSDYVHFERMAILSCHTFL